MACENGLSQLKDLTLHDAVITRSHGLMSPVCLMMNSTDPTSDKNPRTGVVLSGSLGNGLPSGDLAVGTSSTFISYQRSATTPRLTPITNEPSSRKDTNVLVDCPVEALCVPVFKVQVEILVLGIYVMCPSLFDVSNSKIEQHFAA